jgi:quercetin dioxygenase-like cupin family protein
LIFALSTSEHDARHRIEHRLDDGTRLVWELLDEAPAGALAAAEVVLEPAGGWLARLDRVDFPPGGVAYRHTHPGPGIRYLVAGALTIDRDGSGRTYRTGEAWFEDADDLVLATASAAEETGFVRVLLLPREWAGRRTIRYADPADEAKPKLQRAEILREEPLEP